MPDLCLSQVMTKAAYINFLLPNKLSFIFNPSMRHIEFFNTDHFEAKYFRVSPTASLAHFIDFTWETDFDDLLQEYPKGFSDALFPNVGYTYLINLGTPFIMHINEKNFK